MFVTFLLHRAVFEMILQNHYEIFLNMKKQFLMIAAALLVSSGFAQTADWSGVETVFGKKGSRTGLKLKQYRALMVR